MSDRAFPADVVQRSFSIESSARDLGGESARTMGIVAPRGTTTRFLEKPAATKTTTQKRPRDRSTSIVDLAR